MNRISLHGGHLSGTGGLLLLAAVLGLPGAAFAEETAPDGLPTLEFFPALSFRMAGPFRGGRVTAVAGVAGPRRALYMGAAGGGVWRTVNDGLSYENVSDGFFEVGSVGAIEVAPSDPEVIYVGTGSACIRSNVSTGRGVYKSTDGARTWRFVGLPEAGAIGAIRVHPADPNLVYAAVLGHPFGPNPERGVYRSRDGGQTWERNLFVSPHTGAVDLVMNPDNPSELYAAFWTAERKPWTIISGGPESGIYKTSDGGDHWFPLRDGLPAGPMGRIGLALSPADPARIYALVEAAEGEAGLYRSDNAGQSFQRLNTQMSLLYRPFYYTHIHADPNDANTVYVSNESFFRSSDGGRSFSRIGTPHGDNHALWINPKDSTFLFLANDGGVSVSRDGGKTWSSQNNQATAEFYHVVVDNQFPYRLYGEQQDNSTISIPSLPATASAPLDPKENWYAVAGCETGPIALDPDNPNIVYGGCKGRFGRYNRLTGQESQYWVYPQYNYGHAASDMRFRFQRTAPIEVSPHDPRVIYHASQFVHRTRDEGRTWETISPDLTAREPDKQGYSGGPITRDITGEEVYSAIYALRESPLEEGLLWVGSNDGLVHVSRDGGRSWRNVTPTGLPLGGRVQTIDPSPHRAGRALISVYRFLLDDFAPYIFKTEDYGETWQLLTDGKNGMPADSPTRVAREDPNREGLYYAGTEFGLFISFDAGRHWRPFQLNLPATPITDIKIHRQDLALSTMGRSFWILDDLSPLHQLDKSVLKSAAHLFAPRDTYRLRWLARRSRDDGAAPEYPPFGVMIRYWIGDAPQGALRLEILDDQDRVIRTFSSTASRRGLDDSEGGMGPASSESGEERLSGDTGLHRVVWDLRYPGPEPLERGGRGGRGPMAPPGEYRVRLTVGDWTQSARFRLMIDPRVSADGVTEKDLSEQFDWLIRVRDDINRTRELVRRVRAAREKTQARKEPGDTERVAPLDRLEEKLIQAGKGKVGAQLQPMLVEQFLYLYGMLQVADQKPGQDAHDRLADLEEELGRLEGEVGNALRPRDPND